MRMNKRSSLPAAADADRAALRTKLGLLLAFLLGIGIVLSGFVGLSAYRQSGFSDEAGFKAVHALSSAVSGDWKNVLSPFLSSLEPQDRAALEAQALDLLGVVWERRSDTPESLERLLGASADGSALTWKLLHTAYAVGGPKLSSAAKKPLLALPEAQLADVRVQLVRCLADDAAPLPACCGKTERWSLRQRIRNRTENTACCGIRLLRP